MKIGELVHLNREGNFTTSIDLTSFRDPIENWRLCESFCFAELDKSPTYGSFDWVRLITRGLAEGNRNVWSLTANYGHGKTHFAVILANYFGQPWGAPELGKIQDLLSVVSTPALAEQCLSWREGHPRPYLTLCLQGHAMPTLRQAVFQEVERELGRHEGSANYAPPLWHTTALRMLDRMDGVQAERAKQWSEENQIDLGDLRRRLESREASHELRDLLDRLNSHITDGMPVDLKAEVTTGQLLDKLYGDLCGPEGPFSGIAIIFDEFHRFVENMARRKELESLQELLEAMVIGKRKEKGTAFFIALGTMDPNEVARQRMGNIENNPVIKELGRIEKGSRFFLRSDLEMVLDGLLSQQEGPWAEFEASMRTELRNASFAAYQAFNERFRDELKWGIDDVHKKVTKGAFPLHPLTTQLLSNTNFQVVSDPRGVLDFVKAKFERYRGQEADRGGRPNWVVAVEMYETFSGMLRPDVQAKAANALDALAGNAEDEHKWTIAAMTLITAASIPTPAKEAGGYAHLIAEMADMDLVSAQKALKDLDESGVIELDPRTGAYRFPSGANRAQFQNALRVVRPNVSLENYTAATLTARIDKAGSEFVKERPGQVRWGHPDDWAFRRVLVTRAQLANGLSAVLPRINESLTNAGTKGWPRAAEVIFIPLSAGDVQWIENEGSNLIHEAFPTLDQPPVVILTNSTPAPEIEDALLNVLASDLITGEVRAELREQYTQGVQRLEEVLKGQLSKYAQSKFGRIVSPKLKPVMELHAKDSDDKFRTALLSRAYSKGVGEFVSTSSLSSAPHNAASARVATALLANTMPTWYRHEGNGPAKIIAEKYVRDAWGMVSGDWLLRTPQDAQIKDIWAEFQGAFPAGSMGDLGPLLNRFSRAPYGLDTCTLVLVICGWLGSQGRGLTLTLGGRPTALSSLGGGHITELLGNLLRLRVKREDVGQLNERAQNLISLVEAGGPIPREEAEDALRVLEAFAKDPLADWEKRTEEAFEKVRLGREKAKTYSELVAATTQQTVEPGKTLERIEEAGKVVLGVVRDPDWPSAYALRDSLVARLLDFWNLQGDRYAQIADVGLYSERRSQLNVFAKRAREAGAQIVADRIGTTVGKLDDRKKQLTTEFEQKAFVRALKEFQTKRQTLAELRRAKESFEKEAADLGSLAPDAQTRYESKVAEIDTEISQLIRPAEEMVSSLDSANNWRQVQSIQRDLERISERLMGTHERHGIEEFRKKVDAVRSLFETLGTVEENPPEKRFALQKEVRQAEKARLSADLPQALRDYAGRVVIKLNEVDQRRIIAADKLFAKQEKAVDAPRISAKELEQLRDFFSEPSEYLSEEARLRAAGVIETIDAKLTHKSAERIRSIASTLVGDKKVLLELAAFLRELAEEG